MSLTQNIPSQRQYTHATGNSESFDLFDYSTPNNNNNIQSPPPPPPARNNAAFSTNNPFRRAPPPPTSKNPNSSSGSYHEHHHQKSDSSYLQVTQSIDPTFRSHSANQLETNHTGASVKSSAFVPIPPNNRASIYSNPQYSNSDQSVFVNNSPQRQPPPQQQRTRRDVNSYLSHSSNESTSSQSSANRFIAPRTATGSAAAARRKSTNPFLDWDEPAPAPRNRSIPNERLIEEDYEDVPQPSHSRNTSYNNNTSSPHVDDSYSNKRSSRHLLRRTNSNDSIFAAPEQQRPKPQRPPQASKPQYSNRQSVFVNSAKLESPPKTRHTRSNSDSSVMEPPVRQSSSNRREERRGNEDRYKPSSSSSRRHDDRYKEDKYKESSSSRRHHSSSKDKKSSSSSSRRSKKGPPLDTIDRLDVTGFFGPGNFHHDGPFDACTPHRNKYNRKAPVAAFPIDGANNTVTGVDPNRDRYASENQIMGRGDSEAFQDFSVPLRGGVGTLGRSHEDASTFDASLKQKPVHGNTSLGLGSSTFLDGAPASKIATDKYNQEQQQMGLSRKKSLAQRFRGGNGAGPAVSRDTKMAVNTAAPAGIAGAGSTLSPTSPRDGYSSSEAVQPEQVQPHTKSSGLLRRVKSLKVGSSRR